MLPPWAQELGAILSLLALVSFVVYRLPRVDLGHSESFRKRRVMNWLPVGLTYAFLYMARYNLNVTTPDVLFTKKEFSDIYFWGTLTYGISFIINGPVTDRIGGRKTIVIAAVGSALASIAMAVAVSLVKQRVENIPNIQLTPEQLALGKLPDRALLGHASVPLFSTLYAINMYFQSFGAVSIVKVNSAWFHLKERGTFGGIFGILISLGLYFAFDWCAFILKHMGVAWVFIVPAGILLTLAIVDALLVRDTPGEAGHIDFALGDATRTQTVVATKGDAGYRESARTEQEVTLREPVWSVAKRMLQNPAIITIMLIEFCSGYLRNSILQYYKPFAKELGRKTDFVLVHWGMLNCMAGICGGMLAGIISDKIFGSRRGPVAAVLYAVMVVGSGLMFVTISTPLIGWVVVIMSLAIIGVHGMLSGTASMDFGGKQNTGIVVGIIDGFVYLGTAVEALVLGRVLPKGPAAQVAQNWWVWPSAMLPFGLIGFALCLKVWHARPTKAQAH